MSLFFAISLFRLVLGISMVFQLRTGEELGGTPRMRAVARKEREIPNELNDHRESLSRGSRGGGISWRDNSLSVLRFGSPSRCTQSTCGLQNGRPHEVKSHGPAMPMARNLLLLLLLLPDYIYFCNEVGLGDIHFTRQSSSFGFKGWEEKWENRQVMSPLQFLCNQ